MAVERPLVAAYGDRLFEQRNGAIAEALAPVSEADAFEQLSTNLGLEIDIARDLGRASIEQLLGGGLMPLCVERIGLRKYVHQERRDLLGAITLGAVASRASSMRWFCHRVTPAIAANPMNDAATPSTASKWRRMNFEVL